MQRASIDVWHIIYNHVMAGPQAIVEWFKGSALRPFLDALDAEAREVFLTDYTARIAKGYPALRWQGPASLPAPIHCRSTLIFPAVVFATRDGSECVDCPHHPENPQVGEITGP